LTGAHKRLVAPFPPVLKALNRVGVSRNHNSQPDSLQYFVEHVQTGPLRGVAAQYFARTSGAGAAQMVQGFATYSQLINTLAQAMVCVVVIAHLA
jgi:hypothetical protein